MVVECSAGVLLCTHFWKVVWLPHAGIYQIWSLSAVNIKHCFQYFFSFKYRIQETKHLSTNADTYTDTKKILLVRQMSPLFFSFLRSDFTPFKSKRFQIWDHFFYYFFPRIAKYKKFGHWTWGQKNIKTEWTNKKNCKRKFFCRGDFTPLMSKSFPIWYHFFLLLLPKNSENPTSLDIGLREVGAKRPLNKVRNTY